jgi:hypothetical protein
VSEAFRYRIDVLRELERHGIKPRPDTPPGTARGAVRELYKYEIRVLRERYLRKEFSKADYADLVDQLRRRYPVLALLPHQFLEP